MQKKAKNAMRKGAEGFTNEERSAMKERAYELKVERQRGLGAKKANGEGELLSKIDEMPEPDRAIAMRLHEIIRNTAPTLAPRTWYGMPAYAKDGDVVCFFQSAHKFKARYATLGFSDKARLDNDNMWPIAFALKKITIEDEVKIAELIRSATS